MSPPIPSCLARTCPPDPYGRLNQRWRSSFAAIHVRSRIEGLLSSAPGPADRPTLRCSPRNRHQGRIISPSNASFAPSRLRIRFVTFGLDARPAGARAGAPRRVRGMVTRRGCQWRISLARRVSVGRGSRGRPNRPSPTCGCRPSINSTHPTTRWRSSGDTPQVTIWIWCAPTPTTRRAACSSRTAMGFSSCCMTSSRATSISTPSSSTT